MWDARGISERSALSMVARSVGRIGYDAFAVKLTTMRIFLVLALGACLLLVAGWPQPGPAGASQAALEGLIPYPVRTGQESLPVGSASVSAPVAGATPGAGAAATGTPAPAATASAEAGKARIFRVVVPAERLNLPVSNVYQPGVRDMATFMQGLTAYADGIRCTSVRLSDRPPGSKEDAVLELGSAGQPAACSRAEAKVTFTQDFGRAPLITAFALEPGRTVVLDNLAVEPPHTGGASPGVTAESAGERRRTADGVVAAAVAVTAAVAIVGAACVLRRRGRAG